MAWSKEITFSLTDTQYDVLLWAISNASTVFDLQSGTDARKTAATKTTFNNLRFTIEQAWEHGRTIS